MKLAKIKSIKKVKVENEPVYDISVLNNSNFVLSNSLVVHNCRPYQFLKNVIYEQRVDMYESQTLIEELVNLERNINTGKVDHPDGFRKDVSDAFCGATFVASEFAEEYAYNYGETYETFLGSNNVTNNPFMEQRQMMVDFQEQLKQLDPVKKYIDSQKKQDEDYNQVYITNDTLIW